ncbi:hypothetical protein PFY01_09065 [Brevundimonas vesicularis]|uniref:hypothetical protein n=1 Tax=Brevundimonas vesicularis TaxID=41276 RepID=UPI0022EC7EDD|nr:hypothetical protein [Brevundimonas vesicularis]WBT04808.1 hypothetical protein PFY01_08635 [Brevundimonas vesicularis]WBT04892.1 hypothetical protein PFY01_09065 [Brevundimonas vesicularis]
MLSRRNLFAAAPAAVVIAAIPAVAAAASSDFATWERMTQSIDERIKGCMDDDEVDTLSSQRWDYERLIAKTPARSRDDLLVKVRHLKHLRACDLDADGYNIVEQIAAFLEGVN